MEILRRSLLAGAVMGCKADGAAVAPGGTPTDQASTPGSFRSAGAGAVIRSTQDKLRDVISPKDFGAVLDGAADDTASLEKTIAYAASRPGAVIDLGGGAAYCGALTLSNSRGIELRNGRINVKGDVVWLKGAANANSITFLKISNLFFDCSEQRTPGIPLIDFSKITYSTFKDIWIYNSNQGKTIGFYAAGDGTVGPYYNVFDNIYGGGLFAGIKIASARDVVHSVNNNTMSHLRFTPGGSGRYGVLIGTNNQQNRIHDAVFEDTAGGIGIYDDGICTQISGSRFEGLDVALEFGPRSAGGSDFGSYFDSNQVNRKFATPAAEGRHNSLAASDGSGEAQDNILPGGLKIGGGFMLRGDPGFPPEMATGQGLAYPSRTLGGVFGGWGSTNDTTEVNRLGQIVSANPTGTLDRTFRGQVRAARGLGVGNSAPARTLGALTRKVEIFDAAGRSLGFVPIYDTIR